MHAQCKHSCGCVHVCCVYWTTNIWLLMPPLGCSFCFHSAISKDTYNLASCSKQWTLGIISESCRHVLESCRGYIRIDTRWEPIRLQLLLQQWSIYSGLAHKLQVYMYMYIIYSSQPGCTLSSKPGWDHLTICTSNEIAKDYAASKIDWIVFWSYVADQTHVGYSLLAEV